MGLKIAMSPLRACALLLCIASSADALWQAKTMGALTKECIEGGNIRYVKRYSSMHDFDQKCDAGDDAMLETEVYYPACGTCVSFPNKDGVNGYKAPSLEKPDEEAGGKDSSNPFEMFEKVFKMLDHMSQSSMVIADGTEKGKVKQFYDPYCMEEIPSPVGIAKNVQEVVGDMGEKAQMMMMESAGEEMSDEEKMEFAMQMKQMKMQMKELQMALETTKAIQVGAPLWLGMHGITNVESGFGANPSLDGVCGTMIDIDNGGMTNLMKFMLQMLPMVMGESWAEFQNMTMAIGFDAQDSIGKVIQSMVGEERFKFSTTEKWDFGVSPTFNAASGFPYTKVYSGTSCADITPMTPHYVASYENICHNFASLPRYRAATGAIIEMTNGVLKTVMKDPQQLEMLMMGAMKKLKGMVKEEFGDQLEMLEPIMALIQGSDRRGEEQDTKMKCSKLMEAMDDKGIEGLMSVFSLELVTDCMLAKVIGEEAMMALIFQVIPEEMKEEVMGAMKEAKMFTTALSAFGVIESKEEVMKAMMEMLTEGNPMGFMKLAGNMLKLISELMDYMGAYIASDLFEFPFAYSPRCGINGPELQTFSDPHCKKRSNCMEYEPDFTRGKDLFTDKKFLDMMLNAAIMTLVPELSNMPAYQFGFVPPTEQGCTEEMFEGAPTGRVKVTAGCPIPQFKCKDMKKASAMTKKKKKGMTMMVGYGA